MYSLAIAAHANARLTRRDCGPPQGYAAENGPPRMPVYRQAAYADAGRAARSRAVSNLNRREGCLETPTPFFFFTAGAYVRKVTVDETTPYIIPPKQPHVVSSTATIVRTPANTDADSLCSLYIYYYHYVKRKKK